jgi:Ca2+-binding EF-hand superfamily protein
VPPPTHQILTKHEFKYFIFPQISPEGGATVLVPEALEDLDTDGDGEVSLSEFLSIHDSSSMVGAEDYFNSTLDTDGSGRVDVGEIVTWVKPVGFVQAKSEVIYLLESLGTVGLSGIVLKQDCPA